MAKAPETPPEPPDGAPAEPAVEVDVARTGGFAGMTRRWSAQPAGDEASDWLTLIDRCPWEQAAPRPSEETTEAPAPPPRGADRFVWWIRASWPAPPTLEAEQREAELPDDELTGAWRELVDAVRSWGDEERERPGR